MDTTFGDWVRTRRRALDRTQAELAAQVGYSTITVRRVESGQRRPSRQLVDALAERLEVPVEERESFRDLGRRLVGAAPAARPAADRPTAAFRLQPPAAPRLLTPRPRLQTRLDEAWTVPLTTVVAGTGFGKTVAVGTWAEQVGAAWLTASAPDTDLGMLTRGVRDAIRIVVPGLDPTRIAPLGQLVGPDGDSSVRADAMAARVVQSLSEATERSIALVIDDAEHLTAGSAGLRMLEGLVRLAHPRLHLVLVSRVPPAFEFDRLRTRGAVVEVGPESLRFAPDETAHLLRLRLGEPEDALAAAVHEITEGWPAAVRLTGEALVDVDEADRVAAVQRLGDPETTLFEALARELLSGLSEQVRALLRLIAPLSEVDADLCTRLGVPDPAGALDVLVHRGVLRPRAAESTLLVSDLIRTCVDSVDPVPPSQRRHVLRTGARWLAERGDPGAGLDLLRGAGDAEGCGTLLDAFADDLVAGGHAVAIAAASDILPPGARSLRAESTIGRALVIVGRWEESLACLHRVAEAGTAVGPETAYWTGLIHHLRGDLLGAIDAYDRWRPTPADDPAASSRAHSMRASTLWLVGRIEESRAAAETAMALARTAADPTALSGAHTALAMIATGDGDRRANDVHDRLALEFAQAAGNALQEVRIRSNRGSHLVETAQYALALEELDVAIDLAELTGFTTFHALARSNRAEALAALGRHDEADAEFVAAAELYDRVGSSLVAFPLRGLADLHLARGEVSRARADYERVLAVSGDAVPSRVRAQAGLARVLAATDRPRAEELARDALAHADGLVAVAARLGHGWVTLHAGDRAGAHELGVQAADIARERRDGAGYAEARELAALSSVEPSAARSCAAEAVAEWERIGDRFGAERARYVECAVRRDAEGVARHRAALRQWGVRDAVTSCAGPMAAAAAWTAAAAPAARVRVCLLGPVRLIVDGRDVEGWPSAAARVLVRDLGIHRSLGREALWRRLFPGEEPVDADAEAEAVIAQVQHLVQPRGRDDAAAVLRVDAERVAVIGDELVCDAFEFLDDVRAAVADPGTPVTRLAQVESADVGAVAEGERLDVDAEALREECRAAYLTLLHRLVDDFRAAGDTDGAVRYALRLLRVDPFDETTHLTLVTALADARRHGEALRRYRAYTSRMREVGVEPAAYPG
ncbi:helix-turn-helix domain-containing protein [Microbacterium sp.]|uniref:helix-turn-helix domain-containing protein n=1 Tax=Microbacterium sp. TaxID=51671 RepID=UPI003A87AF9F